MRIYGICFSAAAILLFCGCGKAEKKKSERSVKVQVAKLQKRLFRQVIPVQGTVMPQEYATISAKISGTLENLNVDEGELRKKGDVLFVIDRQVLHNQVVVKKNEIEVKESALNSAKFSLQEAEISFQQAKADYDRAVKLHNVKAISQANFESAETKFKKAETTVHSAKAAVANADSQLKQARSNLAIAEKNLADSTVKAPFDCVITETFMEENEFVSVGTKILKLENHNRLEVICYISAIYYNQVTAGKTKVEFTAADGSKISGVVNYKAPAIEPGSRTFKLKIDVPEKLAVQSGMLCDFNIILQEKEAYGLPAAAILLRANDRRIAFTLGDKKRAESVDVISGITFDDYTEVINADKLLNKNFLVSGQTFVNNGTLLDVANAGEKK